MKQAIREGFMALCAGVLACIAITTTLGLLLLWVKITAKFLDYVSGLV
jgi:hypothetical protein